MIGVSIFFLFAIAGIGSLVLSIMTAVSASKYPDWAFQQAGTSKFVWQILPIILLFVCGLAGGVLGIIWFSGTRDQVERAARGSSPYGTLPPGPQGYGAPPPGWGPPPAPGWGPPPAPGGWSPPDRRGRRVTRRRNRRITHRRPHLRAIHRRSHRRNRRSNFWFVTSDDIRPFRVEVPEAVHRRSARPARAHALARPDPGIAAGATAPISRTCRISATLAHHLRLARAGGPVQPVAELPHRDRRPADSFHPRSLRQPRRACR